MAARLSSSVLTLVLTMACTRHASISGTGLPKNYPITTELPAPNSIGQSSTRTWIITPTSEFSRYKSVISTSVQQTGTSQSKVDSVSVIAKFSISMSQLAETATIVGSIEELSVQAGGIIGLNPSTPIYLVSFNGAIANHQLHLEILNTSKFQAESYFPCESPAATTLTVVKRNIYLTPLQLQNTSIWQDSTSTISCSGSLALDLTTVRTYRVLGESVYDGMPALLITVTERALSTGEGSQNQHRIIVRTQGTGTARLYVDRTTGSLLSRVSEAVTTIQIQASGRQHEFRQISRETTLRN